MSLLSYGSLFPPADPERSFQHAATPTALLPNRKDMSQIVNGPKERILLLSLVYISWHDYVAHKQEGKLLLKGKQETKPKQVFTAKISYFKNSEFSAIRHEALTKLDVEVSDFCGHFN